MYSENISMNEQKPYSGCDKVPSHSKSICN